MNPMPLQLHWQEDGQERSALWQADNGARLPSRVQTVTGMEADTAYRLASAGTGLLWRGDFQQGAWGHQHVDAILPWVDVSVSKVAYSAFFNTQLDWVLRHAGVETLAICGIVTNGGVASSLHWRG